MLYRQMFVCRDVTVKKITNSASRPVSSVLSIAVRVQVERLHLSMSASDFEDL